MEYENALRDFLMYSYFGIIPENTYEDSENSKSTIGGFHDYCTKSVIVKAYSDATNEGAYNTLFKKEIPNIDELKKSSDTAKKESAKLLFGKLKELDNTTDFGQWHCGICKAIVDKFSKVKVGEQEFFTYGNAQKWVNMTIKYLWLLRLLPNGIKEEDLHIPVDSFIIDALWKDENVKFPLKEKTKRNYQYTQPSNYVKPWSQWNNEDYMQFRKSILIKSTQETTYNLAWENGEWIKKADYRKNKSGVTNIQDFFDID